MLRAWLRPRELGVISSDHGPVRPAGELGVISSDRIAASGGGGKRAGVARDQVRAQVRARVRIRVRVDVKPKPKPKPNPNPNPNLTLGRCDG